MTKNNFLWILQLINSTISFYHITVHLGSSNRPAMSLHEVDMNDISVHPQYVPQTRAFDIAVVRLQTAIVPRAEISPIALPPLVNPPLVFPLENEEGSFAGFGFQTIDTIAPSLFLNSGYQRATSNARCVAYFILDTNSAFCAEDVSERSSACQGDIGSPFVMSYRFEDILVGVVSMHPTPCGQMSPTAYTRVSFHRQWIQSELNV